MSLIRNIQYIMYFNIFCHEKKLNVPDNECIIFHDYIVNKNY